MNDMHFQHLDGCHHGCHLVSTRYTGRHACPIHGHDFAEIFWVEEGSLIHQSPNSTDILHSAEAIAVSPDDRHALRSSPEGALITNIAIDADVFSSLHERYHDEPSWPWRKPLVKQSFAEDDLPWLRRRINDYLLSDRRPLARDAMLLDCLMRLCGSKNALWSQAPTWLANALEHLSEPPHLSQGLSSLPHLTGRSREHCSRLIRQCCAMSARELNRELRLRWAERALTLSDMSVHTIAANCGFSNRTHFHRLFRERYGQNPAAFRRAMRTPIKG